jgi:cell division protein FtsB
MQAISMKSFWLPVMLMTLIAAFFGALLAHRGREWDNLLAQKASLQAQLGDLEEQNARLRAQRRDLLSSPEAIERVAREDYGFAAPGERVQAFNPRLPARPEPAAAPAPAGFSAELWRHVSIVLPLATFVLTGFVFALVNILSGKDAEQGEQPQ